MYYKNCYNTFSVHILCTHFILQFPIELHVPDLAIVVQPAPDLGQQGERTQVAQVECTASVVPVVFLAH